MSALTLPTRNGNATSAPTAPANGTGTTGGGGTDQAGQNVPAAMAIPFTRASVQKSKFGPPIGPYTLATSQTNFGPYQIPTGGLFRSLRLQVSAVAAGNSAAVAFQADGPFSCLDQIALLSASGGTIINPIPGYLLYAWNKYGVIGDSAPSTDPKTDPSYSVTTGAGATGGSFAFTLRIPIELDPRDALGVLPNMAGNALFQLNGSINTLASIYSVTPTNAPVITITPVYEFWALPDMANTDGTPQAQYPPGFGTAILIQNQNFAGLSAGQTQKLQLANVGNIHRMYIFLLRTAAGVRTRADWPTTVVRYVNGNPYNYKSKSQWEREQQRRYSLNQVGGGSFDAAGQLDTGVYVWSDFVKDGGQGSEIASSACNRNEWPVTERASVLEFDFISWGASASSLFVSTLSVTTPGPQQLYQPYLG